MGLKDSSNQAHVAGIQSVEAKDDHTVVITLKAPDASYLTKLASNAYCILDSKLVKENGRFHRGGQGHRPGVSEQKLRRFRPLHPGELDAGK